MTAGGLTACLLNLAAGAVLPGPAEGGAELRYAEVLCSVAPAVVKQGEEATLTVRLTHRSGVRWHEARLLPARVETRPAGGWAARFPAGASPGAEGAGGNETTGIDLPAPEIPDGPREFTVLLRAGDKLTGYEALELRMRYGVRVDREEASEARRARDVSQKMLAPEVIFEEATLTVELPAALPAVETGHEARAGTTPGPSLLVRPLPGAESVEGDRGSPLLPALFFALATAMVFAGLTFWVRRRRDEG